MSEDARSLQRVRCRHAAGELLKIAALYEISVGDLVLSFCIALEEVAHTHPERAVDIAQMLANSSETIMRGGAQ